MFRKKDKEGEALKGNGSVFLGDEETLSAESSSGEMVSDEAVELDSIGFDEEEGKPKKKKLPGWVIIPILGVLALVLFGVSKMSGSTGTVPELQVVQVEKGDVKEVYNTSGIVESERTKVFYSPVNAPVQVCNAKIGQSVKAGDLLIGYDISNLEQNNQESQLNALATQYTNQAAAEESQRSSMTKAESEAQMNAKAQNLREQISVKESEYNNMQDQLMAAQGDASQNASLAAELQAKMQENQSLQSQYTVAKENAERELNNIDAVYPDLNDAEEKLAKKAELVKTANEATAKLEVLKSEYRSYEQQLSSVGSSDISGLIQQIAAAEQELSSLRSSLTELESTGTSSVPTGLTSGQVNNMQVSENLSELAVLQTEELVAKGREGIKAEFDGIISDVKAAAGSEAMQGAELFTLVSSNDVNVKLEVSANDFDSLKIGSTATIKLGDKKYNGTLKSIDKIALPNEKGTPVIGAKVHIDNPDQDIYIGVNAKVNLNVAEKKNVLCLPNEVVNTASEGDFVYVIRSGEVKKQPVELGIASSSKVEITDGLKEGDQVVSDVSGTVTEGMKAAAAGTNTK